MSVTARGSSSRRLSLARAHGFRQRSQRLTERSVSSLTELTGAIGYVAVPGGSTPYLALRARAGDHVRQHLNRAVYGTHEVLELPFARGTTVLAPATDAPFVLASAQRSHEAKAAPLRSAGFIEERKLAGLMDCILTSLLEGPLSADDLRTRIPQALCVPLGDSCKKAGFGSLFSLALRELQLDGQILRERRSKMLDQDGFVFRLNPGPPHPDLERPAALAMLAGRYFRAYAPAPVQAFAFWADTSITEARTAVAHAELASIEVQGFQEPFHLAPEQLEELHSLEPPPLPPLAFVPFRDPYVSGARDIRHLLPEPHREKALADWRGRLVPAGGGSAVHQHFLLAGGEIAGIWEFDAESKNVRYATFVPLPQLIRAKADEAASQLAAYIERELISVRFYAEEHRENFGRLHEVTARWS